jgi:hypothetical protein
MKGETWIGGPTDNLKSQHVPGYAGYIPQISSENLYGKSFAKTSAKAINGDFEKGNNITAKERFQTENNSAFNKSNFRNLQEDLDPAELKDISDAYNFNDAEF